MSKVDAPRHDPVPIGEVAEAPFARVPEPISLFAERALRLRALAAGHQLAPFLTFLGNLIEAQYRIQDALPDPEMPPADAIARARDFNMPPLDRNRFTADEAFDATFERLLSLAREIEMPATAKAALERVAAQDAGAREAMIRALLADSAAVETLAEHVFVAAALQVHFARLAARLDAKQLVPIGEAGTCPACGGPPVSSMIVGWKSANGLRFCTCALCSTQWNVVRVKCTVCASTKGIGYQEVEGAPNVKAETCDECHSYVKILQQQKDPNVEALADDAASLALDMLVREKGYRRGAFNPFLLGY